MEDKVYLYKFFPQLHKEAIEQALKYNERIICTNATVVVNDDGKVTGWWSNDSPPSFYENG